ncbi:hypothetical protein GCM10009613_27990 [Pseudonocardia kongjuensis]|uniref:Uncharacterized protein n=1 Tax=Pseudonocardia kongjuensis TaxID=102227 RepID=A0ABP4IJX9_9PSEU
MTSYAHDPTASVIVATWPTGDGTVAARIARVPRSWDAVHARRAAGLLTRLSELLWSAYAEDEAITIQPFRLVEAVRLPEFPPVDPARIPEERDRIAHTLGRVVAVAPGRAFADAVVDEVRAEIEAVLDADAGDLTGRSAQAVTHVRIGVPAEQLTLAHRILHEDPLGAWRLLSEVEPTAAATAALRWLRAAAAQVSAVVGHPVADVVALAEAIGHEDLPVTRHVLQPGHGEPVDDTELVRDLLQEAVLAGRGLFVVCPDAATGDGTGHRMLRTVLDPAEPGPFLVEGLLRGIHGCFRVYADELTTRASPGPPPGPELRLRFTAELRRAVFPA